MLIGDRLREARKAAGYKSQAEFAERLGVDTSRVSRWESGAHTPDPEFRKAIHQLLGTSDEDLFAAPTQPAQDPTAMDRAELIITITSRLSALNELEMRTVLSMIDSFPSARSRRVDSVG